MLLHRPKCQDWIIRFSLIFFLGTALVLASSHTTTAAALFPVYPSIQKNVLFWEAIYSRYTTRQGVLHDANDLGKIYAVIHLVDWEFPGATRINGALIKGEKERIVNLLDNLANGKIPPTSEARRIAALFPPRGGTTFHEARDNVRLQLGQKDRFVEGAIRSGKYISTFRKIFRDYGLPQELVYLPHVESSFNPKAHSKAGAAGLWQFTRSTGSDYLTITPLIDERYDPYTATDAAARLLKANYQALGNWPLAITAYNYGRAGMLRAVRDKGNYEKIFESYDQGYFKFASRNFYSEFLAALRVAKRLEGSPSFRTYSPEPITSFRLPKPTSVPHLCALLDISKDQFLRLNPALRTPVIEGTESVPQGYLVRRPAQKSSPKAVIAKKPVQKPAVTTSRQRNSGSRPSRKIPYIVQRGDTITAIARKLQVPSKAVIAANDHHPTVQIGKKLYIAQ